MFQRGINLCGIESEMATTTPSTGDVVKPVVWKNSTSGYSSSNCGYAGFVSSSSSMTSKSLDNCGSQCVAISTCNYFSFSNSTCSFLTFASLSVQPLAYVDPTQSCGSVIKRVPIVWTNATSGGYSYSNCGYTSTSGYSAMSMSTPSLDNCASQCIATSACNYFTYSGITCTFMIFAASVKPVAYIDSTQKCGSVISRASSVTFKNSTGGYYSYANCSYTSPSGYSSTSMSASSLDNCGNLCAATSTCNYFTFSGTTCSFLTFATSVTPFAITDSTQSCGSVIKRPIFNWTTNGTVQTSTNCDFTLIGSYSSATIPGTSTLAKCITYCTTTYPSYCNFFTLSTAGVCTLKKSTTKPSPVINSANSNCGWVPSKFTG